jgi:hypothetical protein
MLALSAALAAACFVKAFGVTFLGRPRTPVAASAHEVDRASLAAMLAFAVICLLAGILPGLCIDALSAVTQSLVGAHMPVQAALPWLSIVPIAESRSSYNGLLVFGFIAISTIVTVEVIHRFASRAVRRAPAWDCGYPDANPATQYTADSFAQPIRRVFGTVVCNPPYRAVGNGRLNPHPEKALARHELTITLPQLVQAARHLLRRRGLLVMVYHPARLSELFAQLEAAHLRPRRMRLVHATERTPACIVLVEAIRDGRDALTILPPLWVYEASGDYTAEMQAIFQGRAVVPSASV